MIKDYMSPRRKLMDLRWLLFKAKVAYWFNKITRQAFIGTTVFVTCYAIWRAACSLTGA